MRKTVLVLALTAFLSGATAAPALAAPDLPTVPKSCHEWNDLLGIDNVRDCEDPDH